MPDITRLEDDDKTREEILKLQQTALDHAWNWWKYHAEQRIALIRFFIIALVPLVASPLLWDGRINSTNIYCVQSLVYSEHYSPTVFSGLMCERAIW